MTRITKADLRKKLEERKQELRRDPLAAVQGIVGEEVSQWQQENSPPPRSFTAEAEAAGRLVDGMTERDRQSFMLWLGASGVTEHHIARMTPEEAERWLGQYRAKQSHQRLETNVKLAKSEAVASGHGGDPTTAVANLLRLNAQSDPRGFEGEE